ncbi:MAG: glycosyltransferase family 39 protein [Bryobacteraceae bacterium]|jgi:hypothetical protein
MSIDHILNTNAFEPLFWAGCVWLAIRAWNTGDARYWLGFGVVAGLGLENKHAMLFFGFGFVAGLLLTPLRKSLAQRNLWLGGAIAGLIFLPNIIWEIRLGWPTLEFLENAVKYKNAILTPWQFFTAQLELTVAAVPVWIAGLWFFFLRPSGRKYRALGWTYVIVFAALCALGGKGYYLLPAYPMLLGAGGVCLEEALARRPWQWLRPALVAAMLALAAVSAPMAVPLLPVETFIRYAARLGIENLKRGAPRNGQAAAILCGHVRMAKHGGAGSGRVSRTPARGSSSCRHLRLQLRRCGSDRLLRPRPGAPQRNQRTQQLLLVGSRPSGSASGDCHWRQPRSCRHSLPRRARRRQYHGPERHAL